MRAAPTTLMVFMRLAYSVEKVDSIEPRGSVHSTCGRGIDGRERIVFAEPWRAGLLFPDRCLGGGSAWAGVCK